MSWQTFLDDNMTRADTSVGAAGTNTGAGNGWIDNNGNTWHIASNQLLAVSQYGSGGYVHEWLYRPAGENRQDQRLKVTFVATATGVIIVNLRFTQASAASYTFDFDPTTNGGHGSLQLFAQVPGLVNPSSGAVNIALSPILVPGDTYSMDCQAIGSSPTYLSCTLKSETTGLVAAQFLSVADSNASLSGILQGTSSQGICINSPDNVNADGNATVTHVTIYSVAPDGTIPVDNPNIAYSPYNWVKDGANSRTANNPGAYAKFAFTGTSVGFTYDTGGIYDNTVVARCSVDNGAYVDIPIGSGTAGTAVIATGLGAGTHTCQVWLLKSVETNDRWTVPTNVLKITGWTIDSGGAIAVADGTAAAVRTPKVLCYGDSITEGVYILASTTNDSTLAWPGEIGEALSAEIGQVGFGRLGWITTGNGNVPQFHNPASPAASSWRNYDSTHSRLSGSSPSSGMLEGSPDYCIVNMGTNDNEGTSSVAIQAAIVGFLTDFRAACPTTKLALVVPYGGYCRASINAAVATYLSANPSDTLTVILDLGADASYLLNNSVVSHPSRFTANDNLHPNQLRQAQLAARVVSKLVAAFGTPSTGGGGPSGGGTTGNGVTLQDLRTELAAHLLPIATDTHLAVQAATNYTIDDNINPRRITINNPDASVLKTLDITDDGQGGKIVKPATQ